ncbi:MAG: cell wall-active antibiotics response protein [Thermoanaerobaculia bacterium]|nr:cell wall-active antibiotics response protein [Thermoanaerobaculia bacterium]
MSERSEGIVTPRLIFGLTLIVIGVAYSLDRLGYLHAGNLLSWWPLILVMAGLGKLLSPGSSSSRWTGLLLAAIGIWLLLERLGYFYASFWDWWPLLLIILGIRFIFQGANGAPRRPADGEHSINGLAMLGGGTRSSSSADFQGGDLVVFMGGFDIDLRQARIQDSPVVIDAFAFWGGIDLRVPDDWHVTVTGIPLLGAFEDDTDPLDEKDLGGPVQELVVKGYAIMGGVTVKN